LSRLKTVAPPADIAGMSGCGKTLVRQAASVAIAILATGALAATADAATFTVNDTTDTPLANPSGTTCVSTHEGSCTLRAAVQAANNSGGANTITVPAGEYKLTIARSGGEDEQANGDLDVNDSSLTITGAGASSTIIAGSEADRVLRVHEGAGLQISGVTVEHGGASAVTIAKGVRSGGEFAGGAFLNEGTLTIRHCVLSHDHANELGGAVFAAKSAASTTILGTTAEHDTSEYGAVMFVAGGSLTVEGDVFEHNEAELGGGAIDVEDFAEEGESEPARPVSVARSKLSNNTAAIGEGGALYLGAIEPAHWSGGEVTVVNSTLDSNTSGEVGGAIADISYGKLTVENAEVSKDKSAGEEAGGAVYAFRNQSLTVRESVFLEDSGPGGGAITGEDTELKVSASNFNGDSGGYGGSIYQGFGSTGAITTSTFVDNVGTADGGAIFLSGGADLSVLASTFKGNLTAGDGGAIDIGGEGHFALTNDTFEANEASEGGAINIGPASEGERTLLNDTIVRNHASGGGSGIYGPTNQSAINDTIVAENSGTSSCNEAANGELQGDVGDDGSCFGESSGEPEVGTLKDNGGPVETDAISEGSLAHEGGAPGTCAPTDARGVVRPEHCDPGAYQIGTYTAPPAPLPTTDGASAVSNTGATLNGTVNPEAAEIVTCEIEYGLTSDYEAAAPCSPAPGEGSSPVPVSASVEGLEKGTTYHYRVVVTTAGEGRAVGADETFETADEQTTTTTTTSSSSTTTATTTTTTTTSASATATPPTTTTTTTMSTKSTSLLAQPCRSR
jgi:CSLREA domain-containing protein